MGFAGTSACDSGRVFGKLETLLGFASTFNGQMFWLTIF